MYYILLVLIFVLVFLIAMGVREDRNLQKERQNARNRVEDVWRKIELYDKMASETSNRKKKR